MGVGQDNSQGNYGAVDKKSDKQGTALHGSTEQQALVKSVADNHPANENQGDNFVQSLLLTMDVKALIRACFTEFLGDIIFVFVGTLQGLGGGGSTLVAAFAHGITIAVLIASLGHISGGHFNPAVTLGVAITRNINPINAVAYVVSQISGGFIGSLLARAVLTPDLWNQVNGGFTIPSESTGIAQGIVTEAIMTMFLVQTVLISAVDTNNNLLAPFAIGLSILVDILAGGSITGASMNPARTFGPAIVGLIFPISKVNSFYMQYIYWVGQIIGAGIAAVIYILFLAREDKRILLK